MEQSLSAPQAIHRIDRLCGARAARLYAPWIQAATTWPGAEFLFGRIRRADSVDEVLDYIAELRYALVFRHLRFTVKVEPLGQEGPDFEVSRGGLAAVIEVTRFRPMNPGPPESDGDLLAEYGNPERDIKKSLNKSRGKFRQLRGDLSILAIWNDDDALEEVEMDIAVRDIAMSPHTPAGLQFVLFGSSWVRGGRSLHCFPVRVLEGRIERWADELRIISVDRAIRESTFASNGGTA